MRIFNYIIVLLLVSSACTKEKENWTPLFNGENLEGWHTYGNNDSHDGWYVEDQILQFDFKRKKRTKNSNLVSNETYTNFELSLEWKISTQGNSGLFWGVIEDEKYEHPYQTGPEIQILDDTWKAYVEGRGDINRAGSLYGLLAPSKIVSKPPDEWNHYLLHIDHSKNKGFLKFNGTKVLDFPVHGPQWEEMIFKSNFADWQGFGQAKTGHISFQDHGGTVAFKNVKIRILD